MKEILTCSQEELPASPTRLPDCAKASKTPEATSHLNLLNWLIAQEHAGSSGKTFRECYQVTEERILPASYRFCAAGKSQYQSQDGVKPGSSPRHPDVSPWRGECWMLNIPEWPLFPKPCPSGGAVCSLSDILEIGFIPQKYYLTAKCASGILRRAATRGKELPAILKAALIRQSRELTA